MSIVDSAAVLSPTGPSVLGRLTSLAGASGLATETLGDLLIVRGGRATLEGFVLHCAATLTAGEAATTRYVILEVDPTSARATDVLAPALAAESLATAAAREAHGKMLDALSSGDGVQALYQPIIDIRSGRTTGFEALLRLRHDGRAVPPLEVFRAAAEAGRLSDADAASRRAAISGASGWIGDRTLFLNLLPESIAHPDDLTGTDGAVASAGLERGQVTFESGVPEGDVRHLARVLEHLRDRGFGIALDDVGGDASVRLIGRLRPDVVKIARPLVHELPALQARATVATVVGAAHAVGARVVAKGIETAAQLEAALFVGVDEAQGWQVGQPMRAPGGRASGDR